MGTKRYCKKLMLWIRSTPPLNYLPSSTTIPHLMALLEKQFLISKFQHEFTSFCKFLNPIEVWLKRHLSMIIKKKNPSRRHSSKSRNDSRAFGKVLSRSCTKTLFPVSVKLDEKVVFCLPTAGGRTQFYHFIFTQPGKSLLVQPCILLVRFLLCRRKFFAHFQCRVPQRCSNKEHFLMSVRLSVLPLHRNRFSMSSGWCDFQRSGSIQAVSYPY